MDTTEDRWLTRAELAERLQLPIKTIATWPSTGLGPRFAKFGKHVRYRLSDVITWENGQFREMSEADGVRDAVMT